MYTKWPQQQSWLAGKTRQLIGCSMQPTARCYWTEIEHCYWLISILVWCETRRVREVFSNRCNSVKRLRLAHVNCKIKWNWNETEIQQFGLCFSVVSVLYQFHFTCEPPKKRSCKPAVKATEFCAVKKTVGRPTKSPTCVGELDSWVTVGLTLRIPERVTELIIPA